jgi:DNA-binding NtrC family response regulator
VNSTVKKPAILIVDDEEGIRNYCSDVLSAAGYRVLQAADGNSAGVILNGGEVGLVILDLSMPGMSGLELLAKINPDDSGIDVVIMTGFATVRTAVQAMRAGAHDYIEKPFQPEQLLRVVNEIYDEQKLREANLPFQALLANNQQFSGLVGTSLRMQELYRHILRVAPRPETVLITGESGTGKELIARAMHQLSPRKDRPFVVVDCGGINANVIESELFGHVKGAFTSAVQNRSGLLAEASDGTVFFDEAGELPPDLQVKLLRVLQDRTFRPVGGDETSPFRARVLAATNADLEDMLSAGKFRKDLYFRLNVHRVEAPPLRSRKSDIPILAQHLLDRHTHNGGEPITLSGDALAPMIRYDWPGNVRELENCIIHALAACDGHIIEPNHLPENIRPPKTAAPEIPRLSYLQEAERRAILEVLNLSGGNRSRAADLLGVAKTTVYRKMREYGIELTEESLGKELADLAD